jgi:hypothetical protein
MTLRATLTVGASVMTLFTIGSGGTSSSPTADASSARTTPGLVTFRVPSVSMLPTHQGRQIDHRRPTCLPHKETSDRRHRGLSPSAWCRCPAACLRRRQGGGQLREAVWRADASEVE